MLDSECVNWLQLLCFIKPGQIHRYLQYLLPQPEVPGEERRNPASRVEKPTPGESPIRLGDVGGTSGTSDHRHLGPGGGCGDLGGGGGEEQARPRQG